MSCGNCVYFKGLFPNTNFGKCVFPEDYRKSAFDVESVLSGLGYATNIPIVHKEDVYTCFVGISEQ